MTLDLKDAMTPEQTVAQLDKFIIGQERAKKAIAIALRNRVRRRLLADDLRDEVVPKNIIMAGPTGVGKTEIARRVAKLTRSPFIKVEATKYTEIGYVGRDVESMIRDLVANGVVMVRKELMDQVCETAAQKAEEQLLDLLLPKKEQNKENEEILHLISNEEKDDTHKDNTEESASRSNTTDNARNYMRQLLIEGKLDEKEIEIILSQREAPMVEMFSGMGMEDIGNNMQRILGMLNRKKKKKTTTVKNARSILIQEQTEKLIDEDQVAEIARARVQEMGIVFIDEIDKIVSRSGYEHAEVSREGVQRDILPIIEGAQVNTRYGVIDTTHILFIAAGAFHTSKPSDLIPELQGRFPLRVELDTLGEKDFYRILSQPQNSLIRQYSSLLSIEDITLEFSDETIREISRIAAEANTRTENIGARRLHTVMELLLEDISFNAPTLTEQTILITPQYVQERLSSILHDEDLNKYIL